MTTVTTNDLVFCINILIKKAGDNERIIQMLKKVSDELTSQTVKIASLIEENKDNDTFVEIMNMLDSGYSSYVKLTATFLLNNIMKENNVPYKEFYFEMDCDERSRESFIYCLLTDYPQFLLQERSFAYSLAEDLLKRCFNYNEFVGSQLRVKYGTINQHDCYKDSSYKFYLIFHIIRIMLYKDLTISPTVNYTIQKYPLGENVNIREPLDDPRQKVIVMRVPYSASCIYISNFINPENYDTLIIICHPTDTYLCY